MPSSARQKKTRGPRRCRLHARVRPGQTHPHVTHAAQLPGRPEMAQAPHGRRPRVVTFPSPTAVVQGSGLFFFNYPATTEIYTLSLHDALPISPAMARAADALVDRWRRRGEGCVLDIAAEVTQVTLDVLERTIFSDGLGGDPEDVRTAMRTYF